MGLYLAAETVETVETVVQRLARVVRSRARGGSKAEAHRKSSVSSSGSVVTVCMTPLTFSNRAPTTESRLSRLIPFSGLRSARKFWSRTRTRQLGTRDANSVGSAVSRQHASSSRVRLRNCSVGKLVGMGLSAERVGQAFSRRQRGGAWAGEGSRLR